MKKRKRDGRGDEGAITKKKNAAAFPDINLLVRLLQKTHKQEAQELCMRSKLELVWEHIQGRISRVSVPSSCITEWIQSVIISSSKLQTQEDNACLHSRTWDILRWSLSSRPGIHVSPGILRGVEYVLTAADRPQVTMTDDLYESLGSTLELLMGCYRRTFRPQLLDWVPLVTSSVQIMTRKVQDKGMIRAAVFVMRGFASFLESCSNFKVAFQVIVEKLMEPLLRVLGQAQNRSEQQLEAERSIKQVLEAGLFHSSHLEGLSEVCSRPGTSHASNHKLFFDKLRELIADRSFNALGVYADIFRLFAQKFRAYRASMKEDVFGVRGASFQSQEHGAEENHTGDVKDFKKGSSDEQRLFAVFREITSPLLDTLEASSASSRAPVFVAVNNLLQAARSEHIYLPTRDTPSQEQFNFIKRYYNLVMSFFSKGDQGEAVAGELFMELVNGIKLVLELDHRVVEDSLESIWTALLLAAAQIIPAGEMDKIEGIVSCGCKVLTIWSELRISGTMLRALFTSLRSFLNNLRADLLGIALPEGCAAMKTLFCHSSFVEELKAAMGGLPEGQAASIVDILADENSEVLDLVEQIPAPLSEAMVKVVSELLGAILEMLNVTSTSAVIVACRLRDIVDSRLKTPLNEVLDNLLKHETDNKRRKKKKANCLFLKAFLLLRLYMHIKTLHRQCVSLMSPQKALKAENAFGEISIDDPEVAWSEVAADRSKLEYFSSLGHNACLPDIIGRIRSATESKYPALFHTMDRIILHRLYDLRRYIQAVEYNALMTSPSAVEDLPEQSSKWQTNECLLNDLVAALRTEAKDLVELLLSGSLDPGKASWDGVVSTLSDETLQTARWMNICRGFDVWRNYGSKKAVRVFVTRVLKILNSDAETCKNSVTLACRALFQDIRFHESEEIRVVIPRAVCSNLCDYLELKISVDEVRALNLEQDDTLITISSAADSSGLRNCVKLLGMVAVFPWSNKSMQYVHCLWFVERIIVCRLNSEASSRKELLQLLAISRQNLQSLTIDHGGKPFTSFLKWLYHSICVSSKLCDDGTVLGSLIKSTQCFFRLNMEQACLTHSDHLLTSTQAKTVGENVDDIFSLVLQQHTVSAVHPFGLIASVSSISSSIWSITATIERVDKVCQDAKGRDFRWSANNLPESWRSFLRETESIIKVALSQFIDEPVDSDSILDILERKPAADSRLLEEMKPSEDKEVEDKEVDDEEMDDGSTDISDNEAPSERAAEEEEELEEEQKQIKIEGDSSFAPLTPKEQETLRVMFDPGNNRALSEAFGELLMATGGLIKLRSLCNSPFADISISPTSAPGMVSKLLGIVCSVFKQAASFIVAGKCSDLFASLSWVFGAVKCMEAMGSYLPSARPELPSVDFSSLVTAHMQLLGAIRSIEVSTGTTDISGIRKLSMEQFVGELRKAVRNSFAALLRYSQSQLLVLTLRIIRKSIFNATTTAMCRPGYVGMETAAAVECLASTLDAVSGPWRLKLLGKYSSAFASALFLLIAHIQTPATLFQQADKHPDEVISLPVLLQCLEILVRLASRNVLYPMKRSHISLALHCPSSLLRPLCQSRLPSSSTIFAYADDETIIKMYEACCRLLHAVLKHRRRESGRNIAILAESIRVLLYCLEEGRNSWNALCCAQWLRRVYEEVGEQKETLSWYCNHIISDYVAVLSGHGPLGSGLSRELDKELRPGIYALLEACSPVDLQQLYAAFGDGPLRTNFNLLKQDYQNNFKYSGKV